MNGARVMAIVLVALGVAALIFGQFSYTKETHEAQLGPLAVTVKDKEHVNVPQWVGVAIILAGTGLFAFDMSRKARV